MAAKLQSDTNVTVLRPRKARGAKSTGGKKTTSRLKPRPGEEKPAAPKKSAQPTDADVRAETQNRLVALHQKHRSVEAKMSVAQEALSLLREEKQQIRASIQNTCVPLSIYDELHKKVTAKTKRADNELYERQRALAFEAFGLPVGPQPELDLRDVPEAARPAIHWEAVGYSDGIDGQPSDPTKAGVPPENLQDYMRGYGQAMARNGAGLGLLKEEPAKAPKEAKAAPPAPDAPFYADYAVNPDDWTADQVQAFRTWYFGLPEDADVDIEHVGAAAMFDHLVEEEAAGPVADAFEATAEELAGQKPRRAAQERREAEASEFD